MRTICLRGAFEPDSRKAESYFSQIPEDIEMTSAIGKYFQLQSFLKARQHASVQKELESLLQINPNFIAGRILMCQTSLESKNGILYSKRPHGLFQFARNIMMHTCM